MSVMADQSKLIYFVRNPTHPSIIILGCRKQIILLDADIMFHRLTYTNDKSMWFLKIRNIMLRTQMLIDFRQKL